MTNSLQTRISNPPGGLLIWIVIFLELITFGLSLIAMAYYGTLEPDSFKLSTLELNQNIGAINTVFLLTSGFFMALSAKSLASKQIKNTKRYLWITMALGLCFLILKTIEYTAKIEAGYVLDYNTFFNFYWLLTGFHVIHVLVGLIILSFFLIQLHFKPEAINHEDYEAGAAFWHMCDLIWLLLFPVIYLIF